MPETVNLERYLGRTKNRISSIGIELEGAWTKVPKDTTLVPDGSVRFSRMDLGIGPDDPLNIGELPSPILALSENEDREIPRLFWKKWLPARYPQYVNRSCGLHVHMCFSQKSGRPNTFLYQRLMDQRFQEAIVQYVREWAVEQDLPLLHSLWNRLNGHNSFCRNIFCADWQAQQVRKNYHRDDSISRYSIVNYCYSLHKTLEVRLLPMFDDAEQATSAIQRLIDITNAFLVATGSIRERKILIDLEMDSVPEREEISVCA